MDFPLHEIPHEKLGECFCLSCKSWDSVRHDGSFARRKEYYRKALESSAHAILMHNKGTLPGQKRVAA